ncbi:hypothetical protein QYF61_005166, partial [Mycteria americana]
MPEEKVQKTKHIEMKENLKHFLLNSLVDDTQENYIAEKGCLVVVTAEVTTPGSDGVVVARGVEENVPRLPAAVVLRLPVALVAVVVGTAVGAADASVPAVTLLPAGTSYPVEGLEVRGNCVGANDVVTDRDAVGKGITLLVSARDVRLSGSVGGRAVWALPSLRDVKSSVGLTVAPISSSEASTVESRDEDTFKTGVAGKDQILPPTSGTSDTRDEEGFPLRIPIPFSQPYKILPTLVTLWTPSACFETVRASHGEQMGHMADVPGSSQTAHKEEGKAKEKGKEVKAHHGTTVTPSSAQSSRSGYTVAQRKQTDRTCSGVSQCHDCTKLLMNINADLFGSRAMTESELNLGLDEVGEWNKLHLLKIECQWLEAQICFIFQHKDRKAEQHCTRLSGGQQAHSSGQDVRAALPVAATPVRNLSHFPVTSYRRTEALHSPFNPDPSHVLQWLANHIGWKRPLRSPSPTVNLTLPRPPLHHVPKHLIQTAFKYLQGWRLNHFPGQPVPMLDNPFSEVKFPNIQSKPPLVQLEAISSCPITCYLGEETDPHLSTTSFQAVVESHKVSPLPPLLQAKQPQFPQPLPIRLLLQTLHHLHCPSLDTLQHLNVSLVVRDPKLNTGFEGHDHFPSPAGHAIFDTSQDAIGFLGHLGTLLAHIQAAVNQHPQVLLCQAAFQPLFPKPAALHGVAVAQVQDLALGLVKPHTIDLGPSIQPVQVPLQSLPTLQQINTPAQLGVVCKLTEGALDPFNWPQHRALGNTTCDWPPTGVNSIHHHSLGLAIQPVLNPAKSTPIQATSSQFLQENAVGNCVSIPP